MKLGTQVVRYCKDACAEIMARFRSYAKKNFIIPVQDKQAAKTILYGVIIEMGTDLSN